jgi:signal transduction histidine kinase
LTRTEIDLSRLVETMVDLYEPSMADRGIRIRVSGESGVTVNGDEGLIHRMIANLLDNELKHLTPGSNVSIALGCRDDMAIVTIEDNGRGFEPEVLEHLFVGRVKGITSTGHGLGLAFVDAVVQAHGGTVKVTNREVCGARITVSLPLLSKGARRPMTTAVQTG